jgi:ABC-2 type transport system permease protein
VTVAWRTVARTDRGVTIGPRLVKILLALPALAILAAGYAYPVFGEEPHTTARFAGYATGWFTGVVPFVGVLLGYNAVVSERESGAILLSLSLPQSRADVVLGKLASRAGLLGGAMLVALVISGWLVVYPFGTLDLLPFLGFVLVTLGYAAIWVGLGVAASLSVSTKQRALVIAGGLFFLFVVVWDGVTAALELGLGGAGVIGDDTPGALRFVFGLDPGSVFSRVIDGFIDPGASVGGPWYLGEWAALVLFVLWTVAPIGLAYRRFAGRDIA